MKIDLGSWNTRHYLDTVDLDAVPRVGEVVDHNGLHQVAQVVWHADAPVSASVYLGVVADPEWETDIEQIKDGQRYLLTVTVEGNRHVVIGGWDPHWSGRCWVYENKRVPVGTVPDGWKRLPAAMEGEL